MQKQPPKAFYEKSYSSKILPNSLKTYVLQSVAGLRSPKRRESSTGVFLLILRNFVKRSVYRTRLGGCFCWFFFLLFHLSIIAKPSIIYIIGVPDYPSLIFAETNSFDKSRENWQQSRGVLRTPSNICDGAFSQKYFTSYVQRVWWQKL